MMTIHGVAAYLDHLPIWIDTIGEKQHNERRKPFTFEAIWVGEKECANIIEETWKYGGRQNNMGTFMQLISKCEKFCINGIRINLGMYKQSLEKLRRAFNRYKNQIQGSQGLMTIRLLDRKCKSGWREEIMWRQRSKSLWLRDSDQNTKYFHSQASICRKKNKITKLKDESRVWKEADQKDNLIIDYFRSLFSIEDQHDPMEFLYQIN
ncbi:uncharacterized protein LOC121249358 [Juglans microcarpa x Juglans regia]|uniref:uncharacterized protein LOC121249358 n=1 Tax=Juglans microcarpa x Juglans regia TaxID=2249226 RepID=UPI001B7E9B95|nr:uncharacterized protein LOC121249358 [Juglans microcarpa x Juglans regia]